MTGELTDDDISRIVAAVETIETSLAVLAEKRTIDRQTYKRDRATQDIVERRFVKMTDASIDIGRVILRHEGVGREESHPGTFQSLGDVDILTEETAHDMANAARFRNVLAHSYGDVIDHDIVYDAMADLERYRTFLKEIRAYLDTIDAFE